MRLYVGESPALCTIIEFRRSTAHLWILIKRRCLSELEPEGCKMKNEVETLVAAAAKHADDNEGNASMKFSQAALNAANALSVLQTVPDKAPE